MNSISIPFRIGKEGLRRTEDPRKAIDSALSLLMTTHCGSCVADPEYGFIFNNLRFEIFNEQEGVVYDSSGTGGTSLMNGIYEKKVSGSSKNLNTFAAELKQSIQTYEKRLDDVSVSMTYLREERKIYVKVKAVLLESGNNYEYQSIINVWK